jgi:hypothetical protein
MNSKESSLNGDNKLLAESTRIEPRRVSKSLLDYNKANGWPDVTPQQKLFSREFAHIGILSRACKASKVSTAKAVMWVRDPLISAYIGYIQEELSSRSLLTRQFVELSLLEQYEKANGNIDIPIVDRNGDVIMAPRWNGQVALGVLKEMGSMIDIGKRPESKGVTVNINLDSFVGRTVEEDDEDDGDIIDISPL